MALSPRRGGSTTRHAAVSANVERKGVPVAQSASRAVQCSASRAACNDSPGRRGRRAGPIKREKMENTLNLANDDENVCPNNNSKRRTVKNKTSRMGPHVSKLSALFDGTADRHRPLPLSSSKSTGWSPSSPRVPVPRLSLRDDRKNKRADAPATAARKRSPAAGGTGTQVEQRHEKDEWSSRKERRRLLLQERRLQKASSFEKQPQQQQRSTSSHSIVGGSVEGFGLARNNKGGAIVVASSKCGDGDMSSHCCVSKANTNRENSETLEEAEAFFKRWKKAATRGTISSDDTTSLKALPLSMTDSAYATTKSPLRALTLISQLVLVALALMEVQQQSFFPPALAEVLSYILPDPTGRSDIFHVVFVVAFFARAVVVSLATTLRNISDRESYSHVRAVMLFLCVALCWMTLLPVFKECGAEAHRTKASSGGRFCLFVESICLSSDGSKGKVASLNAVLRVSSPRYSLLDLLARGWYTRIKVEIKSKIKARILRELRRPLAFKDKLRKLFTFLRYAKFAGPVLATCNKLRGHVALLFLRSKQHQSSQQAQQRWHDLLDALRRRTTLERAVLRLQKQFRERRARKAARRCALMISPQRQRRDASDRSVARQIRRTLTAVQCSTRSKLKRMDALDARRHRARQVSCDERRDISRHKASERRRKKRLLLSPKTSFAICWKYVTVAFVALEILQMACAYFSGQWEKMPLDQVLRRVFNVPHHSCEATQRIPSAPYFFVPVIHNFDQSACTISPWRQSRLAAAHVIATVLVRMVNAVFFLDVFFTFFTGELKSSGTLVPKPFFARYILPGIGLQLLVNPTMVEISRLAKQTLVNAVHVGPSLCFHLLLVSIPFAVSCHDRMLDIIFDFVERQNKIAAKGPMIT